MAEKPLYYSDTKSSPMYYGGQQPAYGGTPKGPMYYGASRQQYGGMPYGQYGAYGSYGAYGGAYGAYGGGGGGGESSMVGAISIGRIFRVITQRWLSVFVFLLIGLIVSFAVYSISPTIYEAKSQFTMDIRRNVARTSTAIDQAMVDYGNDYAEIFNTRLPEWRSETIVKKIVDAYRNKFPTSTVTEDELISTLSGSEMELQRNSRIIVVSIRSKVPETAMALANAYVQAIVNYTEEENKARCDKAVSQIHQQVEKCRREKERLSKDLLEFRTLNKVDALRAQRDQIQQTLSQVNSEINSLGATENQLVQWEALLAEVQKNPERFGALSPGVPRAQEIAAEYEAYQKASSEYNALLLKLTEESELVKAKAAELEGAKQRFLEATERAHETGVANLKATRNQLAAARTTQDTLTAEFASVVQKIVFAESGLSTLESEFTISSQVFQGLIMDENKARMEAESNNEIVTAGRPASLPTKPVLPNPMLIFGVGTALAIALGILFVLILDNLEDTVINLADIEGRLALKVLAVLPHVRRKKREHVAKFAVEDKYSQFSEAVAGLRNLLDSPRYEAMTHCTLVISTQPGEGKTITSTSIAISYAQAGRRVLQVDFDLRRPRLARIWELELTKDQSFSHVLQDAGAKPPDFSKIVHRTSVEGLDVICSLPPDGISPSAIFGASVISDFFRWAREHYDRIVVDSPPYGLVGDVVSLAVMVDSVIVMCCPDRTHFKPIQYCTRSLTEAGANILGVVVNDVEISNASAFSHSHRRGYGYGKYGYGGYGYGYGGYGGYGYGRSRARRGDGDNPEEEAPSAAAADAPGKDTPPAKDGAPAVETDELADEE